MVDEFFTFFLDFYAGLESSELVLGLVVGIDTHTGYTFTLQDDFGTHAYPKNGVEGYTLPDSQIGVKSRFFDLEFADLDQSGLETWR